MFNKYSRITKNKEFEQVFKDGRSNYGKFLGIKVLSNDLPFNRFGIIISNKVSKSAVVRNRLRRKIREILKQLNEKISTGNDIVVLVLPSAADKEFNELKNLIVFSFNRLKLFK